MEMESLVVHFQGARKKIMKSTVYLDATIPSFYFEDRLGTILQAWRELAVAL
jgi:hypothetical protein